LLALVVASHARIVARAIGVMQWPLLQPRIALRVIPEHGTTLKRRQKQLHAKPVHLEDGALGVQRMMKHSAVRARLAPPAMYLVLLQKRIAAASLECISTQA